MNLKQLLSSFAVLAFMSQGHLPGQGKYGPEVAKGVKNLLEHHPDVMITTAALDEKLKSQQLIDSEFLTHASEVQHHAFFREQHAALLALHA